MVVNNAGPALSAGLYTITTCDNAIWSLNVRAQPFMGIGYIMSKIELGNALQFSLTDIRISEGHYTCMYC